LKWIGGREITAARSVRAKVPSDVLVGQTVQSVEAKAKHLLIRFESGLTLHTHMRMEGSWHVYRAGERWRKPDWQARLVLEAGERVAVCFNAPVVELLTERDETEHPSLAGLGPDVLKPSLDLGEVRRRAETKDRELAVGDLLLDQQVVSGIGNIYRCEALFLCRINPWTPWPDAPLDDLVTTAARIISQQTAPGSVYDPLVYGRTRRPCQRCRTPIQARRMGEHARTVYWCPRCQPEVSAPSG
jgi:endonuclease VIII